MVNDVLLQRKSRYYSAFTTVVFIWCVTVPIIAMRCFHLFYFKERKHIETDKQCLSLVSNEISITITRGLFQTGCLHCI